MSKNNPVKPDKKLISKYKINNSKTENDDLVVINSNYSNSNIMTNVNSKNSLRNSKPNLNTSAIESVQF
jgi:hypothetical protein